MRVRRHGRVRRWVVRPFIWGLLFLFLVVTATWLFMESGYAHGRAVSLVIARTSELLGWSTSSGTADRSRGRGSPAALRSGRAARR